MSDEKNTISIGSGLMQGILTKMEMKMMKIKCFQLKEEDRFSCNNAC